MSQEPLEAKMLREAEEMSVQGISMPVIEQFLKERHLDEELILHIMEVVKKEKHQRRSRNGTKLIVAGVVILGVAFVSSVYLHATGSHNLDFPLYGLTGLGATLLLGGLVLVFS